MVREEIVGESRYRIENVKEIEQNLEVDFPKLQEKIVSTSLDRQEGDSDILKLIQD